MSRIRVIAVCVVVFACLGCGKSDKDQIATALHDFEVAWKTRDAEALCGSWFASTTLPVSLARQLKVPENGGPPSTWEKDFRQCVKSYRKDFPDGGAVHFTITRIEIGPSPPHGQGISKTAKVRIRETPGHAVTMVKYRGDWKIVFEVD